MLTTDLWPKIEPLLAHAERPARYLNHEWGSGRAADADFNFCMVYPDTYELGQANQAVRILVNVANESPGIAAERAYLPARDMCDMLRDEGIPLFSLESCAPLGEFDAIGITLPHELCATNVLEVIDLAGIPIRADERSQDDPFVVAGGPCAFNPEPFAPFFDAIMVGEGEELLCEVLQCIRAGRRAGKQREDILFNLAQVAGTYVPSLYDVLDDEAAQAAGSYVRPKRDGVPAVICKRLFDGFSDRSAWEPCIVPYTECVHDRLNVEVLRGCARGCRFCQAGMMYRPVRERSADNVVAAVVEGLAQTGYDEVSLTSLSTTDHSQIAEILQRLNARFKGKAIRISIPSQRLDSFGVDMAALVSGDKKGGLTFAPEAGTQRLRDVINKNVTEDDVMNAIDAAFAAVWRRCKLFFMIGLPTETDEDVIGIAELAERVYERAIQILGPKQKGSLQITCSLALFVPKAQTPFQWDGQIAPEEALRRVALVRQSCKHRAISITWHDPKTSSIEAVMSRGSRTAAKWVETAWRNGARFDAWTELFNEQAWRVATEEVGLDPAGIAQATYEPGRVMPWSHVTTGVATRFLMSERVKAEQGQTTPDCTFGRCSGCGACQTLDSANALAGERR